MRVLILAAGYGTRLKPITNTLPKCLVEVGEKPLLQHWLEKLENCYIKPTKVYVNLFYKKEMVEVFLENYQTSLQIHHLVEEKLLGTGGTLFKLINQEHDEDLLVIHCDNFFIDSLDQFLQESKEKIKNQDYQLSLIAFRSSTPETCGTIEINDEGEILRFQEKIKYPATNLANGAIYFFPSNYLKIIAKDYPTLEDIARDLLEPNTAKTFAFETKEFFCDIGTPQALKKAQRYIQRNQIFK